MSDQKNFIASAKLHGKGKIQLPSDIRKHLKIKDEDHIIFYQDREGKVFVEGAPKPRKKLGTY